MAVAGVIGAGTMGAGIAQLAAVHGWEVILLDVNDEAAQKGAGGIRRNLDRLVEKQRLEPGARDEAMARLRPSSDPAALSGCELVIEAIVEDLPTKARVLKDAATRAPQAIIATNTSSLPVGAIGRECGAPERTIGMHFFNPAPLMPLVEIIGAESSGEAAVSRAEEVARSWGKTTVRVKDTPGFIVNRVARGYYLEPMRMLAEGVAGVDEIDAVLKTIGGFRMGPFELVDLIGIDVNFNVTVSVWEQLGRPARLRPSPIQQALFERKLFGRKSKQGFYSYQSEHPLPAVPVERRSFDLPEELYKAVRLFCDGGAAASGSITEQYIFARTLAAIINEAALAQDDDIASAEDIDTAMELGTNYPLGPLEWAEKIGRHTCRFLLDALNRRADDGRFAPAWWLRR